MKLKNTDKLKKYCDKCNHFNNCDTKNLEKSEEVIKRLGYIYFLIDECVTKGIRHEPEVLREKGCLKLFTTSETSDKAVKYSDELWYKKYPNWKG